jgi:formyl-CoA transferase
LAFQPLAVADYLLSGLVANKSSRPHLSQSYTFLGKDGLPFAVHLSSPTKFWVALLATVGRPELAEDPRFIRKADRVAHYDDLRAELQKEFSERSRSEWLTALVANEVPAGPIYTIEEALQDPQVETLSMVRTFGNGDRATSLVGYGFDDLDRPRDEAQRPVPELGEHTREILADVGYDEDQIEHLIRQSVV